MCCNTYVHTVTTYRRTYVHTYRTICTYSTVRSVHTARTVRTVHSVRSAHTVHTVPYRTVPYRTYLLIGNRQYPYIYHREKYICIYICKTDMHIDDNMKYMNDCDDNNRRERWLILVATFV